MRFLVFQHIGVEHPGSFRDFMAADGIAWDVVELDRGQPIPVAMERYDALMVMGGPMDVWEEDRLPWLADEKRAIRHWVVERDAPFLGICLGHQLLAEAAGGMVGAMDAAEVGIHSVHLTPEGRRDRLLAGVDTPFTCLQWHGAEVKALPPGSALCAVNATGSMQAFRYGSRAYGFQFHVEITDATVREWGEVPEYRSSLAAVLGHDGLARLERETRAALPAINALAKRVYSSFVGQVRQYARTPMGAVETAAD